MIERGAEKFINLKAVVRYDGGPFAGWQVQPGLRTVQGAIEDALSRIAGRAVRIHGSSRTDAGVHALGQVFSFEWPADRPYESLPRSLSQMLRPYIATPSIERVPPDFHARRDAVGKRYVYTLRMNRIADPFACRYAWAIPWRLNPALLNKLAQRFVGRRDFAGFRSSGSSVRTSVRTIHAIALKPGPLIGPLDAEGFWRLEFEGDGFLYKMVRNITGVLVEVARGRLPETFIDDAFASEGPFTGYTAPAHGLALAEVRYEE
jgi:tRNA pseudouridine38-40 synthase